jgi:hypothetical protein
VTCAVSEGDSPLKITWLKDGRPLKPREASTHHIGEFDLALRIQSASTAHNGNYTCVASNDAAKTSRTASLLVHGTQPATGITVRHSRRTPPVRRFSPLRVPLLPIFRNPKRNGDSGVDSRTEDSFSSLPLPFPVSTETRMFLVTRVPRFDSFV